MDGKRPVKALYSKRGTQIGRLPNTNPYIAPLPYSMWGLGSIGRALALHVRDWVFDSLRFHHLSMAVVVNVTGCKPVNSGSTPLAQTIECGSHILFCSFPFPFFFGREAPFPAFPAFLTW